MSRAGPPRRSDGAARGVARRGWAWLFRYPCRGTAGANSPRRSRPSSPRLLPAPRGSCRPPSARSGPRPAVGDRAHPSWRTSGKCSKPRQPAVGIAFDGHDIDPPIRVVKSLRLEEGFRHAAQAAQLGRCHCILRRAEAPRLTRLDFDEDDRLTQLRHQIEFPFRRAPVAGKQSIALTLQLLPGDVLSPPGQREAGQLQRSCRLFQSMRNGEPSG